MKDEKIEVFVWPFLRGMAIVALGAGSIGAAFGDVKTGALAAVGTFAVLFGLMMCHTVFLRLRIQVDKDRDALHDQRVAEVVRKHLEREP